MTPSASSDWDPTSYGRVNTLQQLVAEQALAALTVRGDEDVLDIGCGDGRVTELVLSAMSNSGGTGGTLVGIDPSAAMVASAQRRLSGRYPARFEVGTAAALTDTAAYDLVTSFNALHWETRWREALVAIRAALRPAGRAFLVFVCDGGRPSVEDVVVEVSRRPRWAAAYADVAVPFVHVDPEDYRRAAEQVGLRVDALVVDDLRWDFGSRAAFADWCAAGLVAWTGRLPETDRGAFVAEVVDAYAAVTGSDARLLFLQCRVSLTAV